jgi:methyl-accepting chemotaxis protein
MNGLSIVKSIQVKITFIMVVVVCLLLGIFGYFIAQTQKQTIESNLLEKGEIIAATGAQSASDIFEQAIRSGQLTEKQLFDTKYIPIPGTDPQKYHTSFDAYTDKVFQKLEDSYLKDDDVVFAAIVDRNGYLPTHNTKFSVVGGDAKTNRTKRLFDDPVGLKAAQNTAGFLRQVYKRDTGETMWDLSAPIYVNGKHWGGYRIGFSMDKVAADISENNSQILATLLKVMLFSLLFIFGLASVLISRGIVKPIKEVVEVANSVVTRDLEMITNDIKRIAAGDLNFQQGEDGFNIVGRRINVRSNDEIGELAKSFNEMTGKLYEIGGAFADMYNRLYGLILGIKYSAQELHDTNEKMKYMASEISSSMKQISSTTDQVAEGNSSQTVAINEILSAVNGMADIAKDIAGNSSEAEALAQKTKDTAMEGVEVVNKTITGMSSIRDKVDVSTYNIGELGEYSQRIGNIVEVINGIADQTNLLALNAAIEAARAGEHGRGFAVVADEVMKLAESATKETGDVANLITAVQKGTEQAVVSMQSGVEEVKNGAELANQAGLSLNQILSAVRETDNMVSGISSSVDKLAKKGDEIVQNVESISAVVAQNSAASQEVSASTHLMNDRMHEVVDSINQLSAVAESLIESISYFKLESTDSERRSA